MMSIYNKVVWSEGLFLQPHHFQQQDRYLERYVETRCQGLTPHGWGFSELQTEDDVLSIGKFGLRRAAGVFPDGTPFRLPDDDQLPEPIDVDDDVRDQIVHLAVPLRRPDGLDFDRSTETAGLTRYRAHEADVRDATADSGDAERMEVGGLRTRLLLAKDVTDAYTSIPVAHVAEREADDRVVLEDGFIPTVLDVRTAPRLSTFVTELLGLLHQRGEALGGRAASSARGGVAEMAEILTLQAINRYEPVLAHYAGAGLVHPELLFRFCLAIAGELATFLSESRRPPVLPTYHHDRLRESFEPLLDALRRLLMREQVQRAVPIPIEAMRFGVRVGRVADSTLYREAVFVLGAKADLPSEELRRRFPSQITIGSLEGIRELVNYALPGVGMSALPVVPRQLPPHAGFVFFELDQSGELWKELESSAGVALHIKGEFPGLELELWAIRR